MPKGQRTKQNGQIETSTGNQTVMQRSYPVPFGRHVLSLREKEGLGFGETAERFSVGIASIKRWAGRIAPRPGEHRKVRKIDPEKLAQEVIDHPDACQYDRAARFDMTPKAIWQALGKPGVTYKA